MSDTPTRFFVDASGNYLGGYAGPEEKPFENASEVGTPPKHYKDTWSFALGRWLPYELPAGEKRKEAFDKELSIGDQVDAVAKGLSILIPALVRAGVLTREEAAIFEPGPNARVDEPGGWLFKISEIKARFPKEGK